MREAIGLKKEVIQKHENGVRVSDLALQFGLIKSSTCIILKNMEAIKHANVTKGVTDHQAKIKDLSKSEKVALDVDERKAVGWQQCFGGYHL